MFTSRDRLRQVWPPYFYAYYAICLHNVTARGKVVSRIFLHVMSLPIERSLIQPPCLHHVTVTYLPSPSITLSTGTSLQRVCCSGSQHIFLCHAKKGQIVWEWYYIFGYLTFQFLRVSYQAWNEILWTNSETWLLSCVTHNNETIMSPFVATQNFETATQYIHKIDGKGGD